MASLFARARQRIILPEDLDSHVSKPSRPFEVNGIFCETMGGDLCADYVRKTHRPRVDVFVGLRMQILLRYLHHGIAVFLSLRLFVPGEVEHRGRSQTAGAITGL